MTKDQLKKIAIHATQKNIEAFLPHLNKFMLQYDIVGKLREAAFIAQVLHESGSFRYVKEIASGKAYEGRKDLGNTQPGDGPKFKGRGLIQITGRANYQSLSNDFGVDFVADPIKLEQPEYAVHSACWFWNKNNLNKLADISDFVKITKRINGGTNGIEERQMFYNKALSVL